MPGTQGPARLAPPAECIMLLYCQHGTRQPQSDATRRGYILLTACDEGVICSAIRGGHQDGAQTGLTLMSSAHMRLSKGRDSLNFSIRGSVLPVKRPPHSFFGSEAAAACGLLAVSAKEGHHTNNAAIKKLRVR